MTAFKTFLSDTIHFQKDEYYIQDTIQLEEENKSNEEIHHNKYFELSDYDIKVHKHVEDIFEDKEQEHLHINFEVETTRAKTISTTDKILRETFEKHSKWKIPFSFLLFLPLIRIVFTAFHIDELLEDRDLKEVTLKFVALFLFLLNFFIYFLLAEPQWRFFFLMINNIYLLIIVILIAINKKKEMMEGII